MSPKQGAGSLYAAGSAVKSCRTVLMDDPIYQVVLSRRGEVGVGTEMNPANGLGVYPKPFFCFCDHRLIYMEREEK